MMENHGHLCTHVCAQSRFTGVPGLVTSSPVLWALQEAVAFHNQCVPQDGDTMTMQIWIWREICTFNMCVALSLNGQYSSKKAPGGGKLTHACGLHGQLHSLPCQASPTTKALGDWVGIAGKVGCKTSDMKQVGGGRLTCNRKGWVLNTQRGRSPGLKLGSPEDGT